MRLRVVADVDYPAAAKALGWNNGVPRLDIVLANSDSLETPVETVRTDSTGTVDLGLLESGTYVLVAKRLLNDAEKQAAGSDIEGYVLHNPVRLGDVDTATVMLFASRRGSLVISEWSFVGQWNGHEGYDYGGFLELYNASDTTVFLDSLMLAAGLTSVYEIPGRGDCAYNATHLQPPNAVFVWHAEQFPGTGRQYPLAPGKTTVIATDAIDHRPLFVNQIDLSHADFEFTGDGDVDNPAVPNMIDLEMHPVPWIEGAHGFYWGGTWSGLPMVTRGMNIDTLPKGYFILGDSPPYRAVPVSAFFDLTAFEGPPPSSIQVTRCSYMVNPAILADDARLHFASESNPLLEGTQSVNRRVLYTRPDGRKVLQRTHSPTADLVLGPRTPGWIP